MYSIAIAFVCFISFLVIAIVCMRHLRWRQKYMNDSDPGRRPGSLSSCISGATAGDALLFTYMNKLYKR